MSECTHYACKCGDLFPVDEALVGVHREREEFWGASVARDTGLIACPTCGDDDLEEAWMCEHCQIRRATEEGTDMCAVCFKEIEAEQDATVQRIRELQDELNKPFAVRA